MAGQNLGIVGAYPNEPSSSDAIRGIISSFFNENKAANMSDIRSFHRLYADKWESILLLRIINKRKTQLKYEIFLYCVFAVVRPSDILLRSYGQMQLQLAVE